jgi:uncharacterized protein YbjT (DUF2867 family)
MGIVVIGGTGLIGSKLVARLRAGGHDVVAAAPSTGVNTLTGEGVVEALTGADVVVDVSNSPSFEESAVMEFFSTATRNLLDAARAAGVGHYIALSVVGTQRLSASPYFRAKIAQEELITTGGVPFTIVHATQFFEFVRGIADAATVDGTVRLAHVGIQPMAGDDVADAVARVAVATPQQGIVEVAGPERWALDDLARVALEFTGDPRIVLPDSQARYFGAVLASDTLLPGPDARLATTRYETWLPQNPPPAR